MLDRTTINLLSCNEPVQVAASGAISDAAYETQLNVTVAAVVIPV